MRFKKTMFLVYMKNVRTVAYYSRGLGVLFSNFKWKVLDIVTVDESVDEDGLMKQMKSWSTLSFNTIF